MPSHKSSFGWFTGTVRRWLAVTGAVATLATFGLFGASERRLWAWLTIGFLASWVVAFALTARAEHRGRLTAERRGSESLTQHARLRPLLEAAETRMEYLATIDPAGTGSWVWDQTTEVTNGVYRLLNESLGPVVAEQFGFARGTAKQHGMAGIQEGTRYQIEHLHALLERLDSLKVMGDWQP